MAPEAYPKMILDQIVAHKKDELAHSKVAVPFSTLKERVSMTGSPRTFRQALAQSTDIALIAEIKKASPSAGLIRKDFNPVEIGKIYQRFGAKAVSVLTDNHFFMGSLAAMKEVKQAVDVPVLRKDFIIEPYQIYEARAYGADAVLLIAAILSDDELRALLSLCEEVELEALVEVHTELELEKALGAGAQTIGINNRDLSTFAVDLSTTLRLVASIPEEILCVSESGIKTHDDIIRLGEAGVHAVLVGTALMEAEDIGEKIRELFPPRV